VQTNVRVIFIIVELIYFDL